MLLWSCDTLWRWSHGTVVRGPGLGRVKMRRYHRHPPQSYLLLLFTYSLAAIHTTVQHTSVSCLHSSYMFIFQVCYASDATPDEGGSRYKICGPRNRTRSEGLLATDLLLMDGLLPRSASRRTCNLPCSNVTLCNFSLVRKIDTSGHKKQFERGCRTD